MTVPSKRNLAVISAALVAALLGGCATRGAAYIPIVDMQGKRQDQFSADLTECQAYATQRADAAQGAAAGAVAAALLGAFLAPSGYRNQVAGRAAVLGGIGGAGSAIETQESITKRCLAGRGYSVLN